MRLAAVIVIGHVMKDLEQCEQRILELESLLEISDRKSDVLTSLLMEASAEFEGALDRVERSEKNFRAIFETAPEPIYLIDVNTGRILDCNGFTLSWLGYSREELLSMPADSIVADKAGVTDDGNEKATYRGRMAVAEWCFRKQDGTLVTADVAGTPLEYEGRECFAVLVHDITERKRVEKDLIKAREAAESANRAKSRFLANMSHELRTPMNAILGYSQLMQRDSSLHRDQREYLNIINRSGEHLLGLINDVLEISKIEAKRVALEPTTFDLPALLRDVAAVFRFETNAKGLEFDLEGVNEVPRCVITDESKVRQILMNVLGNAVKFTEKGGIILRVAAVRRPSDEMLLKVEVQDTGPGIAEDEREIVFHPFEQSETGKQTKGGTGLGLAISREYARMLGGDLTVTGRVGEGSVFRLEIGIRE
jgi:PAS domain S-box-containing protein